MTDFHTAAVELAGTLQRKPTLAELAAHMGIPYGRVRMLATSADLGQITAPFISTLHDVVKAYLASVMAGRPLFARELERLTGIKAGTIDHKSPQALRLLLAVSRRIHLPRGGHIPEWVRHVAWAAAMSRPGTDRWHACKMAGLPCRPCIFGKIYLYRLPTRTQDAILRKGLTFDPASIYPEYKNCQSSSSRPADLSPVSDDDPTPTG